MSSSLLTYQMGIQATLSQRLKTSTRILWRVQVCCTRPIKFNLSERKCICPTIFNYVLKTYVFQSILDSFQFLVITLFGSFSSRSLVQSIKVRSSSNQSAFAQVGNHFITKLFESGRVSNVGVYNFFFHILTFSSLILLLLMCVLHHHPPLNIKRYKNHLIKTKIYEKKS